MQTPTVPVINTDIPQGYHVHSIYDVICPGKLPLQLRWMTLILVKDEETDEYDEDAVMVWDNSAYSLFTNPLASAPSVPDAIMNFNRVEKSLICNL